jgi:hypothetical protein
MPTNAAMGGFPMLLVSTPKGQFAAPLTVGPATKVQMGANHGRNPLKLLVLLFAVLLAPAGACTRCPQGATNCPATGGTAATGGKAAAGGTARLTTGGNAPAATGGTLAAEPAMPPCVSSGFKLPAPRSYPLGRKLTAGESMRTVPPVAFVSDLTSVRWDTVDLVNLDQGNIGSCTGNAALKAVCTAPFDRSANETDAVKVYAKATALDSFPGTYPPTDTGSDGNSALQALKNLGWSVRNGKPLAAWVRATSFEHLVTLLHTGPVIIGIPFRQSQFTYDRCGLMQIGTDRVIGGHELAVVQWSAPEQNVLVVHSWGKDYGIKDDRGATGYGRISRAGLTALLADGGDAIGLVPP